MPPRRTAPLPTATESARPQRAAKAANAAKALVQKGNHAKTSAKKSALCASKPVKKSISKLRTPATHAKESGAQAGAVIQMAATALSMRIVAAVEDIFKVQIPHNASKVTQQFAANMAKTIVQAAVKADRPFKAAKTLSFTNKHGEEFQLSVDKSGKQGSVAGDETGWNVLRIRQDALQDDFMFSDEELTWLRRSWKIATGRELKHPTLTAEEQLVQAGMLHRNERVAKRK